MGIVRKAIYPRPGHQLLEVDFSGLEVRIAACYHKDPNMLRYIKSDKADMHRDMMEEIFKIKYNDSEQHAYLRAAAKNGFVFPEFYGDYFINCANYMACKWGELPNGIFKDDTGVFVDAGGTTLGRHLRSEGIKSIRSFEKHLEQIEYDFWTNRFPDYAKWKRHWWNLYKRRGYVDLLTGFRCHGVMSKNDATNYPVQGAAFHCLLWSFIQLDRMLERMDTKLLGQIHDSVLLDVHPDELEKVSAMVQMVTTKLLPDTWKWIIVPLEVDAEICPVDGSWAEKEKFKLVA
jgi:DNA polymerase I-like protein with 3'-5' exonuclease and polymerase domains